MILQMLTNISATPEWDGESLQEDKDGDSGVQLLSREVKEPEKTCVMNGVMIITANVSET
jgi:hypothetical protein